MYLEFNIRLLFFLLFRTADAICAIDLDTILPCYFASKIKGTKRVYDAHELFTELKEVITRPRIQKLWLKVEQFAVPKFEHGYTVNRFIADELKRRYGVSYHVVRNLPRLKPLTNISKPQSPFIIYQGAVNEGRCFETLIPSMQYVDAKLVICGKGNFFEQAKNLIQQHKLEHKIELRGYVQPEELARLTPLAHMAVTLFENNGLNQYYSLANRFFDYIMAAVPQVCVGYPEYKAINDQYKVAYLINDTDEKTIVNALNVLLSDDALYERLHRNCLKAREELNWETEEKVLLDFYKVLFS